MDHRGLSRQNAGKKTIYEILGEPFFLDSEERRAFCEYRAIIEDSLKPADPYEFQLVQNIALRQTEALRLGRSQAGLFRSPFAIAEELRLVFGEAVDAALQVALDYCSSDPKKIRSAIARLESEGLTPDQIESRAVAMQLENIEALDRLRRSRDNDTRRDVTDQKKRLKKRAVDRSAGEKSTSSGSAGSIKKNTRRTLSIVHKS